MSTFIPRPQDINRKWYVLDASGKTLGRLATEAGAGVERQEQPAIYALH